MIRMILALFLVCVSFNFLSAQEINEKAKKYLNILSNKPSSGFMFDLFYGAWMESSDTKELEEYLKKNSVAKPTSENILLLAFYYQKEGQTNKALEILGSVEDQKLLTGEVLYYQARLESSALNFANAIQHIDKAIASPIKDDLKQKLLKLKAQVQYRDGNSKGARETFETLLAVNEKDKTIIEDIMEIQLAEGTYEDAKKHCQKLIDLSTDNYEKVSYQLKMATILKRLNDFDNSEKIYLDLIGLSGQGSWLLKEVVYQFESISRGKDNLIDLVKKYKEIIKKNPQNVYLRKRYSSLLSEKGEKDTAINEFKTIVELLPGDKSIREEYAILLISNGKTEEAIKVLESLVTSKSGSKDYEVILNIADLEFKNKRLPQANEWLQQFLAKKDLTEYEILRASSLLHKHGQVAKEIELLEKYAKEKPEAIGIKESLVHLYLENKDKEKALQVVKTLKVSDDLDLNFRITNQFTKNKLLEEGLSILESVKKEKKETYKYQRRLFELYSDLKNDSKKKDIASTILNVCASFTEISEAIQMIVGQHKEDDLVTLAKGLETKKNLHFKETILLAHLKLRLGKFDLAVKLIEDANKKYGNEILFLELQENFFSSARELERAVQVLDELIKKSPKDSSKYLLLKMNLHKRSNNTDEAIVCAKQLIIATNNKSEHVIALADLYQLKGESSNAIAVLKKASFENTEEKELKVKLIDSYIKVQYFGDARRILWSLLEATEDTAEKMSYMDKLFNCYEYELGVDTLIENLEERRLNNAKSTFPLLALIRVYQRLNDTENRNKYMAELAHLKVDDVQLYLELADVMEKDLDYKGTEVNLKKAVEVDKGDQARIKLAKFYFNIDKDELAIIELLQVSEKSFNEKEIIDIAEKYIVSDKYEKAYEFLKKYVPADRTVIYDYILALVAREANVENAESYFYRLLDKNEEFSKTQGSTTSHVYTYADERYRPEMFRVHDAFRQSLRSYASYQDKPLSGYKNYSGSGLAPYKVTVKMPSNLSQLHYFAIAHLGDICREGAGSKTTEILSELKKRNVEYAELFLSMDKKNLRFGEETAYKKLSLKYPDDIELKALSVLNDREYYDMASEKLLPLISEAKKKDAKLALWLYLVYGIHLDEINQDIISDAESLISKLEASEDVRSSMHLMLFANQGNRTKAIAEDLIEKYKTTILNLIDNSMAKDFSDVRNRHRNLMQLLVKLGDTERYAKIVNKQISSNTIRSQNSNQNYSDQSKGLEGRWGGDARFPTVAHLRFSSQYGELYNTTNRNNLYMSNEFRRQLAPLIENKYLRLSMYFSLKNEEEVEKIIKDLEESKSLDDLHIVGAYYTFKKKDKEALMNLNKALPLATDMGSKKAINARIIFYATKSSDPMIKLQGLNAAKRLKDFNLNKDELLELSVLFDSLGEATEAQKLDEKFLKTNSILVKTKGFFSIPLQNAIRNKIETMFNGEDKDAAFKFVLSIFKEDIANFSDRTKSLYFNFSSNSFDYVIHIMGKNKNISEALKRFASEQTLLDDDLVMIAFIFHKLGQAEEAVNIANRLVSRKPQDLVYKMFAYGLNIKNNRELDVDLKRAINENLVGATLTLRNFTRGPQLLAMSPYDSKEIISYILDNLESKEEDTLLYRDVFISPFCSGGRLAKDVSAGSILNKREKKKTYKEGEEKMLDDYYAFFEELMLKCIKKRVDTTNAGGALLHYYAINQIAASSETIQVLLDVVMRQNKATRKADYLGYSSNNDKLLPISYSFPIYLLNQSNSVGLNVIYKKLAGDEDAKYRKVLEKLTLFYIEEPIKKEDLLELDIYLEMYGGRSPFSRVLSVLLEKIDVQNSHVRELLLTILKEDFGKTDRRSYMSNKAFLKYLGSQINQLSPEDAIKCLLDMEKAILSEPFDKDLFEKNKNNRDHYTRKIFDMFDFDQEDEFDANLYMCMLKTSRKSEFYSYLVRCYSRYSWKIQEKFSIDDLLDSGLFTGNLSEFTIVKFDPRNFLISVINRKLRENKKEDVLEKLSKMQQTDGVKLLSYWMSDKSYEAVFDFLGTRLAEFDVLPIEQKREWADYLKYHHEYEISRNPSLTSSAKKFKSVIDNIGNNKIEEIKKSFFDEKYDEKMDTQQFDDMLREIYPSVLLEKEEKILTAIKSAWQKHKDRKINSSRGNDNYQYDDFVRMLINMESPHRNHLVVATELLSQNLKWPPDYYRRYSLIVRNYMKQRILGSIEKLGVGKNENGWYVFNTKQEEAFKVEFNAVVDDVLSINKNLVPTYMISFRHELNMADSRSTVLKELIDEWGVEKELPSLKKDLYSEFKSSVENNKSILENHFFSMIVDPAIIPQVKTAYIQAILNNDSLDKEKKKGVLEQHVNVVLEETNRFTVNLQEFYRLIGKYDYGTLIESSEFSKMIKVWHGSFEKVLGEGRRGEWRLDNYSLDTQSNVNIYEKIIKLMRNYFSEEAVFTFFNTPKVNFRACSLAYMTFIKEGLEHVVLDALNGNIEEIKINRYEIRSLFLSTEDLERIEQFVKKITDPEKRNFAKILFYRFGTKTNVNGYEEKNLDLFTRSLKEMLENPIEDEKIKKKLLELLSETPLSSDKEIAQMLTTSNESFDESKLKTHAYQDIGISFRHYCIKFSRMLVDKGLEQLKEEVNKTLANIKEREDEVDVDKFILTISDSLAKNLFLDQNIVDNANAYYEAISHVLDSFDHAEKDGQFGFSHALCLLFLDNKADQLPVFLARYKKQHVFHWEKELSTVEAIQLFKTAYLQNPEKSENILKSLNDFLNSKANDYYDYLSEENSKNMFDFIKADADKKQVLESYKKFNQKNKR